MSTTTRCPRCWVGYDDRFPAMSRATAERDIAICGPCGTDEATGRGPLQVSEWPVGRSDIAVGEMQTAPGVWEDVYVDANAWTGTAFLSIVIASKAGEPEGYPVSVSLDPLQVQRLQHALEQAFQVLADQEVNR